MSSFQRAARLSLEIVGSLGINRTLRAARRRSLLVLNYHGVIRDEFAHDPLLFPNVIGLGEFTRQMTALTRNFHPIGLDDLRDWQFGKQSLAANPALVTFDDGCKNNLTCAIPVLERFGIPAVIHVTTGYIGRKTMLWPDEVFWRVLQWPEPTMPMPRGLPEMPVSTALPKRARLAGDVQNMSKRLWPADLQEYLARIRKYPEPKLHEEIHSFLTWDELKQLQARGFVIGSHTVHHPILSKLPLEEVARELKESKCILEQMLGCECRCFAYPNGSAADISLEVVDQVRQAGYDFAFTVQGRLASRGGDPLLLDRVYIPGSASMSEFHNRVSGFHAMLKQWLRK